MANWNGIELNGALAKVIEETPDNELAFYDYIDDLSDQIYAAMEGNGLSKADLARAMGKTRSWVTQVLSGENNMTMKTFVNILCSMNMKAETKIVKSTHKIDWDDIAPEFSRQKKVTQMLAMQRYNAPKNNVRPKVRVKVLAPAA